MRHACRIGCCPASGNERRDTAEMKRLQELGLFGQMRFSRASEDGFRLPDDRRPNTRLKLPAPVLNGFGCRPESRSSRIPFVNTSAWRRSLSAPRYAAHDLKQNLLVVQ